MLGERVGPWLGANMFPFVFQVILRPFYVAYNKLLILIMPFIDWCVSQWLGGMVGLVLGLVLGKVVSAVFGTDWSPLVWCCTWACGPGDGDWGWAWGMWIWCNTIRFI